MIDPKMFDEMAKRVVSNLPPGVQQIQADLEKNTRAGLQAMFSKMDLVTREEFDVQTAVLARTRSQLDDLELRVAELEAQLLDQAAGKTED